MVPLRSRVRSAVLGRHPQVAGPTASCTRAAWIRYTLRRLDYDRGSLLLDRIPIAHLYGHNRLYVDYLSGRANGLFSHPVDTFESALRSREGWSVPRAAVAQTLQAYLHSLDAPPASLQSAAKLAGDGCMLQTIR